MSLVQQSIVKNSVYRGLLSFFNLIVPLLVTPYVYRVLNPSMVGTVEYANSIYTYFALFGVLGIYTYGIREISKARDNKSIVKKVYSNLFYLGACSNLLVGLFFLCFVCFFLKSSSSFYILLILSAGFISNIFYTEWINEAYEDFRFVALKTIIIRSLYVFFIFWFVKTENDVIVYIYLIVFFNFLNYIIGFIYSRRYTHFSFREKIDFTPMRYLLSLFFILILNNSSVFYTLLDRVMLGANNGNEAVAYYSVGQKIMEIIRALLLTLTYVSLPRLSYYLQNKYELYLKNVQRLFHVVLMFAIPMAFGIYVLSESIVYIFAGKQYNLAILPLSIFAFRIIILMIENITAQQILFLHGKEKYIALFNFSFGLLNLLTNIILVKISLFTPFTAVLTTLIIELFLVTCEVFFIKKKINIKINILNKSNISYLLLSTLFIPISIGIKSCLENSLFTTFLTVILCLISYLSGLWLMKDETFFLLLNRIKNGYKHEEN